MIMIIRALLAIVAIISGVLGIYCYRENFPVASMNCFVISGLSLVCFVKALFKN